MGNEEVTYFYKMVPANRIGHTDCYGRDFADHVADEFMTILLQDRSGKNFRFCDLSFKDPDDIEPDQIPEFIRVICTVASNGWANKKLLQFINDSIMYGFNVGTEEYVKILAQQIRYEHDLYTKSKAQYRSRIEEIFRREEEKKILEKYSQLIDKNVNKKMEKRDAKIKAKRNRM